MLKAFLNKFGKPKKIMIQEEKIIVTGYYCIKGEEDSDNKHTIRVLGESPEHEGMWILEEKDAKGVNKLVSASSLIHSYTPMHVGRTEKQMSHKLPKRLFKGIGEEFEGEAPKNVSDFEDAISSVAEHKYRQEPEQKKSMSYEELHGHQDFEQEDEYEKTERRNTNSSSLKKHVESSVSLTDSIVAKFKSSTITTAHFSSVSFSSNFDLNKVINAIDLMELDKAEVFESLLKDTSFKNSLVEMFFGSKISHEKEVKLSPSEVQFKEAFESDSAFMSESLGSVALDLVDNSKMEEKDFDLSNSLAKKIDLNDEPTTKFAPYMLVNEPENLVSDAEKIVTQGKYAVANVNPWHEKLAEEKVEDSEVIENTKATEEEVMNLMKRVDKFTISDK